MTESSRVPADAIKLAEAAFLNLPAGAQFRERLKVLPEYGEPVVVPPAEVAGQMLAAALPAIHAEKRKWLLDDDGPVLLTLREEFSASLDGVGFYEDGTEITADDPMVDRLCNEISDRVRTALDQALGEQSWAGVEAER